jgi:hypothetical protein
LAQIILDSFADQRRDVKADFLPTFGGACILNKYDHSAGLFVHVYIVAAKRVG